MEKERTPVIEPVRANGVRTQQRLMQAMESLLEKKLVEEVSISDIVQAAGVSVGAFYTRFRDKEALVQALFEDYQNERAEALETTFAPEAWRDLDLPTAIGRVVRITVTHFRHRRGLIRAFTQHYRHHPEEHTPQLRSRLMPLYDRVAHILLQHSPQIRHPDPEQAVRFAFFLMTSVCTNRIVFDESTHSQSFSLSDEGLAAELERACLSYLRGSEDTSTDEPATRRPGEL